MLQDFLFTGIGMGSFLETANRFYPFAAVNVTTGPKIYHVHNLFLQVALDLGAPGFLAWLAILVGVTWAAWQVYRTGRRSGQPFYACLGAGILASQAALIVHGMTDAVTWGMVRPAPIVWGLWGIAAAAWLTLREAQPATAALAPGAALVETAAAPESAPGLR
jgi:putative inorganic carbon (HCO3(-)) transporter